MNETQKLEGLCAGEYGDEYTKRCSTIDPRRDKFWSKIARDYHWANALEVGSNTGLNLLSLSKLMPAHNLTGIDVNLLALGKLKQLVPDVNAVRSVARDLPLKDSLFDLVFTSGVLIHQPRATLPLVMKEVVRCSKRYVLCIEYFSEKPVEVPYRGVSPIFKCDYGQLYQELFPELKLLDKGALCPDDGFDESNWWMFLK